MTRWSVEREQAGDGTLWQLVDAKSAYRSTPMARSKALELAEWRNADADAERCQMLVDEAQPESKGTLT